MGWGCQRQSQEIAGICRATRRSRGYCVLAVVFPLLCAVENMVASLLDGARPTRFVLGVPCVRARDWDSRGPADFCDCVALALCLCFVVSWFPSK